MTAPTESYAALYGLPVRALAEPTVERINAYDIYLLSSGLAPLNQLRSDGNRASSNLEVFTWLLAAQTSLKSFLENKAFHLRPETRAAANRLVGVLSDGEKKIAPETFIQSADSTTVLLVQSALAEFQAVLKAESSAWDLYLVGKKRGLDASLLVDRGEELFTVELTTKVPGAIADVRQGTRCMAFELPTAAAYHLHRANEAVLRAYFDVVSNGAPPPRNRAMGNYLGDMDKLGIGDDELKDSIRNLVKNHRNPLIHPEHSLKDINEAINLMNAIHAVMVPMLKVIPDLPV